MELHPILSATVVALILPVAPVAQQPASIAAQTDARIGLKRDPALAQAITDISAAQIRATDSVLVSFGTRHTMSDTMSATRGIGAAHRYLFRRTTAPTHEKTYQAGAATSFLLPDQIDDGWAAVRSVGADGHRSLASAVPPPCPVLATRADSVAAGDLIRNCIRAPGR